MWLDLLLRHLSALQHSCSAWHDQEIKGGQRWRDEIYGAIASADMAVLLVSADFLASDFIVQEEMPRLLRRHSREQLHVYPIIVSACAWKAVPWIEGFQLRPSPPRPLESLRKPDVNKVLSEIVREIGQILDAGLGHNGLPKDQSSHIHPAHLSVDRMPTTGRFFLGREEELRRINAAWEDAKINILAIIGPGGEGKSAIVNQWLGSMAEKGWKDVESVFCWSFFSPGFKDGLETSSDQFLEEALVWVGDPDPREGSHWQKTARLVRFFQEHKSVLVLDGLEPLQHPTGTKDGQLIDTAMRSLIKNLAHSNDGLCVITSRVALSDLVDCESKTVRTIHLSGLKDDDGVSLLREFGVSGSRFELLEAVRHFGGNSLAVSLLGTYLREAFDGKISRWRDVPLLDERAGIGEQAKRVMASYEEWLAPGGAATPELSLLMIMGLFDRPAALESFNVLTAEPPIENLTDPLVCLSREDIKILLTRLRGLHLLNPARKKDEIDAHPLVREYFGRKVEVQFPDAWREGHRRLFEHLRQHTPTEESVREFSPLFAAAIHAARAGNSQEAFDYYCSDVDKAPRKVATMKLCAYREALGVLQNLFQRRWTQPVPALSPESQPYLLRQAAFCLRALGRVEEAIEATVSAVHESVQQENWYNAAKAERNLSEMNFSCGKLEEAARLAQEGLKHAHMASVPKLRMELHATLGDVLCHLGHTDEALESFRQAEQISCETHGTEARLSGAWGYAYCDCLLDDGKVEEAADRAQDMLHYAETADVPLHKGLAHLVLAITLLDQNGVHHEIEKHLDAAEENLLKSGLEEFLIRAFIARSALLMVSNGGDLLLASQIIDRAENIACERGILLNLTEIKLQRARLFAKHSSMTSDTEERVTLREKALVILDEVRADIERMRYGRLERQVESLAQSLG